MQATAEMTLACHRECLPSSEPKDGGPMGDRHPELQERKDPVTLHSRRH